MPAAVVLDLEAEERGHLGDAGGLLHVVGDDHERVLLLQLVHQVLDRLGRDRVERRGRLVEQDDVGLDGDRAGDAEPLLLAAGEAERRPLEPVLDLVPDRGAPERLLDAVVEVVLHAEDAQAVGDVVVDRLRERVRALEDHADPAAHLDRVDAGAVEVGAVVEELAVDPRARDEVVHPVQAAQERRLAAARGADQRRDRVPVDLERDAADRERRAVGDREVVDVEDRVLRAARPAAARRPRRLAASAPVGSRSGWASDWGGSTMLTATSLAPAPGAAGCTACEQYRDGVVTRPSRSRHGCWKAAPRGSRRRPSAPLRPAPDAPPPRPARRPRASTA